MYCLTNFYTLLKNNNPTLCMYVKLNCVIIVVLYAYLVDFMLFLASSPALSLSFFLAFLCATLKRWERGPGDEAILFWLHAL